VTVSLGGLLASGNSRLLAVTAGSTFDHRYSNNRFGASVLANYGLSAPPKQAMVTTAENLHGRVRYDRFILDEATLFLIVAGHHDRFQGIEVRLNFDPGFKYLFLTEESHALWAEGGYDFQYDVRRNDARPLLDANKNPLLDANGQPILLDKTATDHSGRMFVGFRNAFSEEVSLSMGLEYLQSFVDSTRYRLNFDTVIAARLASAFAFGFGFTARFDHAPLPGKRELDTTTQVSLIFAYQDPPPEK
jgi:putative salt-induced outer membrane protein